MIDLMEGQQFDLLLFVTVKHVVKFYTKSKNKYCKYLYIFDVCGFVFMCMVACSAFEMNSLQ